MSLPSVPKGLDPQHQRFLQELRDAVEKLPQSSGIPPSSISNLRVTPIPGGNQVTFTRAGDATGYLLRISDTPNWNPVHDFQIDMGDTNLFNDLLGQSGVKRYYQVISKKGDLLSPPIGPLTAISLAPSSVTTLPIPPVSSPDIVHSTDTGRNTFVSPHGAGALK